MANSTPLRRSIRPRNRITRFIAGPASGRRPRPSRPSSNSSSRPSSGFLIPCGSDLNLYNSGLEVKLDDIYSPQTQQLATKALELEIPLAPFSHDTPLLVKSFNINVAIPAQELPIGVDPRCTDWPRRLKVVQRPKHSRRCRCADCPGVGPAYSMIEVKHLMQVDPRFKNAKFRTQSGRVGKFQQVLCPKLQPTFIVPSLDCVQDLGGQDHLMCLCCPVCSCVPCRKSEPVVIPGYTPEVLEDSDCLLISELEDDNDPNLFAAIF